MQLVSPAFLAAVLATARASNAATYNAVHDLAAEERAAVAAVTAEVARALSPRHAGTGRHRPERTGGHTGGHRPVPDARPADTDAVPERWRS